MTCCDTVEDDLLWWNSGHSTLFYRPSVHLIDNLSFCNFPLLLHVIDNMDYRNVEIHSDGICFPNGVPVFHSFLTFQWTYINHLSLQFMATLLLPSAASC